MDIFFNKQESEIFKNLHLYGFNENVIILHLLTLGENKVFLNEESQSSPLNEEEEEEEEAEDEEPENLENFVSVPKIEVI